MPKRKPIDATLLKLQPPPPDGMAVDGGGPAAAAAAAAVEAEVQIEMYPLTPEEEANRVEAQAILAMAGLPCKDLFRQRGKDRKNLEGQFSELYYEIQIIK